MAQVSDGRDLTVQDRLLDKLEQMEFENLRCIIDGNSVCVSFENREYRSDAEAAANVLHTILSFDDTFKEITILFLKLDLPILKIHFQTPTDFNYTSDSFNEAEFQKYLDYSYQTQEAWSKLKAIKRENSTLGKVDLEIEPKIAFQLGDFTIPFRFEIFMYPSVNVNLWKGALFQASAYVPIYNYEFVNQYKYVRPYILTLTQNFRLFDGNFLKLSSGLFGNYRFGGEAEYASHLWDGRLILRASAALTGRARYLKAGHPGFTGDYHLDDVFEYGPIQYVSYQTSIEARIPYTEVAIQYGFGKYMYDELGSKVLIYRNFNEYIMGLQAYWGDQGTNFGFYLNLPLIPSKYYFNKKIRVKPSKYLNYSYLATSDYYWYFRTGYDTSKEYLELNPQVIMNQLPVYLLYIKEKESKLK